MRSRLAALSPSVVSLPASRPLSSAQPLFLILRRVMSASSSSSGSLPIRMDPFCLKQFQPAPSNGGQHIAIPCKPDEFVHKTNEYFSEVGSSGLKDGYAPFCKHLFIPASRFPFQVACAYAPITEENKHKLESVYSARTDKELPVLTRFLCKGLGGGSPRDFPRRDSLQPRAD